MNERKVNLLKKIANYNNKIFVLAIAVMKMT